MQGAPSRHEKQNLRSEGMFPTYRTRNHRLATNSHTPQKPLGDFKFLHLILNLFVSATQTNLKSNMQKLQKPEEDVNDLGQDSGLSSLPHLL